MKTGILIFKDIDQLDCTGPFEVLSRVPNMTIDFIGHTKEPIRDMKGLQLQPSVDYEEARDIDILVIPGGYGQYELMSHEPTIQFLQKIYPHTKFLMTVCTGTLLAGVAGLLEGYKATTHWTSHHLLGYLGITPVKERYVVDRNVVSTAGVTGGIDGALILASLVAGPEVAQQIQLYMEYDPKPPFNSGYPSKAPKSVLDTVTNNAKSITDKREIACQNYAKHK
jgi:cyclohexyl-isocyanide hydratase